MRTSFRMWQTGYGEDVDISKLRLAGTDEVAWESEHYDVVVEGQKTEMVQTHLGNRVVVGTPMILGVEQD